MPSLIPAFNCDIFISYRHNDNKSGWVTEFVKNLQEELSATIKEPVSVYFDINPHDGLLETHNVDKSLEGKLKCLIFIPILSQTYCDPKSFAWEHEFVAFNKIAKEDLFGKDLMLGSGNVASRILPIKIHDLDEEDKAMLENELGGVLRPVNFIYKESGVNRPLKSDDNADSNLNKTKYRNQINKVANAVKEIINALKHFNVNPGIKEERNSIKVVKSSVRKKPALFLLAFFVLLIGSYLSYNYFKKSEGSEDVIEKSIAVLPFADMSPGKDQEYLGDGIAEEIITALSGIKDLKVIGRTSSFQFKGDKVDLRDIGVKLQVATVLEGSIQKSGDNVRVTAQLIKVDDGSHLWSQRYDRKMIDIFAIQDEISANITEKLKLTLFEMPAGGAANIPTKNMEAYEMVLKGDFFLRQGPGATEQALEFYQKAIILDPEYGDAYLGISGVYFFRDDSGKYSEAIKKAISLNISEEAKTTLLLTDILWIKWNWEEAARQYEKSKGLNIAPNITYAYYESIRDGNIKQALETLKEVVANDPLFVDGLRNLGLFYLFDKQFDNAIKTYKKIVELDSRSVMGHTLIGFAYEREGNFDLALDHFKIAEEIEASAPDLERLRVITLANAGKKSEAEEIFERNKKHWLRQSSYLAPLPQIYFALGKEEEAFKWLNISWENNEGFMINLKVDPKFDPYRSDPRFIAILKKMKFPK
ncbi:MAG: tetratricopeptide repeat protein [Cyclobacteriaceae bacterium]